MKFTYHYRVASELAFTIVVIPPTFTTHSLSLSPLPPLDPSFPSTMSTNDIPLLDAAGVDMGEYDPNCPMPIVELLRREEIATGKDDLVLDPNRAMEC